MSAAAEAVPSLPQPAWLSWLRRELAPFPGREQTTLRMVAAVVLVTIISMALQVPETALSAFMVFFVTKENRALTMLTGILMIVGVTIAVAASLFLSRFTFDHPELRIPFSAATVFAAMFLSRVFVIGPLGFAIGFVVAITQTMGESAPDAEFLVRAFLWVWVAIVFPIVLTVIINQVLFPSDPWNALVRGLNQRLDAAASVLERMIREGMAGGRKDIAILDMATRGSSPLLVDLKFAEMTEASLKPRHASLVAIIAASERLAAAAAMLALTTPQPVSENDQRCANELLSEIARLKTAVQESNPVLSFNPTASSSTQPELQELQHALASFRDCLVEHPAPRENAAPAKAKKSLFVADAFTNPAHWHFALKVTLGAMACYFIYTGLDWPGIHTAFITCCFIALENTGATMRKGWLRLGGCAIGGLLGFLSIMYLVPHMESIVSLALLAAAGSALAGWVAAGGERISYAGLQIGFAFFMCIFQGFAPKTDFDTIRDRLVGIVLGIVVSTAVFHYLWPENALERLRATLASVLRNIASLLLIPGTGAKTEAEQQSITRLRGEIGKGIDNTLRFSELASFENADELDVEISTPRKLHNLTEHAQMLYLIASTLSGETVRKAWRRLDVKAQDSDARLRAAVAGQIRAVAASVEGGPPPGAADFEVEPSTASGRPHLLRHLIQESHQAASIVQATR